MSNHEIQLGLGRIEGQAGYFPREGTKRAVGTEPEILELKTVPPQGEMHFPEEEVVEDKQASVLQRELDLPRCR
ncbi:MAG: hypothetical protein Q7S03_01690 [bacterium]|nr:hypothetical protein [bacterium]